jgi:hypothetical protein
MCKYDITLNLFLSPPQLPRGKKQPIFLLHPSSSIRRLTRERIEPCIEKVRVSISLSLSVSLSLCLSEEKKEIMMKRGGGHKQREREREKKENLQPS